ncbi:sigma-70 family RNA polymerase sigma factor [Vibrio metoecus]|nr:sigma-70 family RNA polymerase sigma factor [Vibrio cholerae]
MEEALTSYFSQVNNHSSISRQEEESLYPRLNEPEVRKSIVEANLKIALKHAHHFGKLHPKIDLADLVCEANLGLTIAIEKFDPTRGFRYSTYAEHWILNRLKAFVSSRESVVKKPHADYYKALKFKNQENIDEISQTKKTRLLTRLQPDLSFDADQDIIDGYTQDGFLLTDDSDLEEQTHLQEIASQIKTWCQDLSDIEKACIDALYGLNDTDELSPKELSSQIGKSYSAIIKIRNRSLRKLKEKVEPTN